MEQLKKSWFDTYELGQITLKNRFIMAPMARMRCDSNGVPGELIKKYYNQRSSFGMIITEFCAISVRGNGMPGTSGIYTQEQTQAWKEIVDDLHKNNCKVCIQLWHCGRCVTEGFLQDLQAWGPSEIQQRGVNPANKKNYAIPHEMTKEEIAIVINEFKQAAINAKKAGFDFIELHGAYGFLVDQFLHTCSNQRKDEYGGTPENQCRFALEIIDQLILVYEPQYVGIRISPTGRGNDMFDNDPLSVYSYLLKQLNEKGIGFIDIKETKLDQENEFQSKLAKPKEQIEDCCKTLRQFFSRTIINNDGFTAETGLERINNNICDLISFGRLAIANPDFPIRVQNNFPLNQPKPQFFFTGGETGFIDYPQYENNQKKE